jgi:nucleoside-diphosphate-sugar epimerase/intein/homing endonuclease
VKILVTGGAGFIGTTTCLKLLEKGHEVIAFDNLVREGVDKNLEFLKGKDGFTFVEGDVRVKEDFVKLDSDIEGIIALAANPGIPKSLEDPLYDFDINARGMIHVLEFARSRGKIPVVFASTNKVYPDTINDLFFLKEDKHYMSTGKYLNGIPETYPMDGVGAAHSPYGASKASADLYCQEYFHTFDVPTTINRMSCITADTLIETPVGLEKVKNLIAKKVKIASFNFEKKQKEFILAEGFFETKNEGKELFLLKTLRGYQIKATQDHKLYTSKGWLEIKDIPLGTNILVSPQIPIMKHKDERIFLTLEDFKQEFDNWGRKEKFKKKLLKKAEKYFPLRYSDEKAFILARLTGFLFGDGTLTLIHSKKRKINIGQISFFLEKDNDFTLIKNDMELLGFKISEPDAREISGKIQGKIIKGISRKTRNTETIPFIIFSLLGVPIGKKSINKFQIPKWIQDAPLAIKREFLRGLFGADLSGFYPYFRNRNGKKEIFLSGGLFSQAKDSKLHENLVEYIENLKELLSQFGVSFSSYVRTQEYQTIRGTSKSYSFKLLNNKKTLLNFSKVGFAFNLKRERTLSEFVEFYKTNCFLENFPKWKHRYSVANGAFWDHIVELKKIPMERIFDINVPKNHNFFANGILVHNCVYGPYQRGFVQQGWVVWFMIQKIKGQELTIFGDGFQTRDCLYGEDLAELYEIQLTHPEVFAGKIYNIGGGTDNLISLLEFIDYLDEHYQQYPKLKIRFDQPRPADQKWCVCDLRKIIATTLWEPKTNLKQGFAKTFEWVENNINEL